MEAALKQIAELCKPGQTLNITQAIDILCDCYNIARAAIPEELHEILGPTENVGS